MTKQKSLYQKLSGDQDQPPSPGPQISAHMLTLNAMPFKVYNLRGVDTQCYTIGSIANALGRSQVTIRSWEQKKWMKPPVVRTAPPAYGIAGKKVRGRRLYTRAQAEYLVAALEACYLDDPKKADWNAFREQLRNFPTQ